MKLCMLGNAVHCEQVSDMLAPFVIGDYNSNKRRCTGSVAFISDSVSVNTQRVLKSKPCLLIVSLLSKRTEIWHTESVQLQYSFSNRLLLFIYTCYDDDFVRELVLIHIIHTFVVFRGLDSTG